MKAPRLGVSALHTLESGCRREYALRYRLGHYWPALPDPAGRAAALVKPPADPRVGQLFHALVHQHALGLDVAATLDALPADVAAPLAAAWGRFLESPHAHSQPGAVVWTEQALNFTIDGIPATVVFDRLVRHGDRWTILDWKTGRPSAKALQDGWQARLYRWALVEAGGALARGEAVRPEHVSLVFWDVSRGEAIPLGYDADEHARTGERLRALARLAQAPFDPTLPNDPNYPARTQSCARCSYRDFCGLLRQRLVRPAASERPVAPRFVLAAAGGDA